MKTCLILSVVCGIHLALAEPPPVTHNSAMTNCPMMKDHDAMNARGDKAMGFAQDKTTHHFRLASDGGAIEVTANNPHDAASRRQIQRHLKHIAAMFQEGNFEVPMFVHGETPDGVATMRSAKDRIHYRFEPTQNGGRVQIQTTDSETLKAVHQFLRFQIREHQTGDPL